MKKVALAVAVISIFLVSPKIVLSEEAHPQEIGPIARSGCCSHHGGVCGCSGSSAQCCDGTESPSCSCKVDSTQGPLAENCKAESKEDTRL